MYTHATIPAKSQLKWVAPLPRCNSSDRDDEQHQTSTETNAAPPPPPGQDQHSTTATSEQQIDEPLDPVDLPVNP